MSNKLVKEKKAEKTESIKSWYGRILVGCGVAFIVMMIVMWQFPTSLDGTTAKIVFTAGFVGVGLLLCAVGIYWIVKKPKVKIGKFMAKGVAIDIAKKLGTEDYESIADIIKDMEV